MGRVGVMGGVIKQMQDRREAHLPTCNICLISTAGNHILGSEVIVKLNVELYSLSRIIKI